MPKAHSRTGKFCKVAENLYRYSSNGIYYAVFRDKGKLKWKSLKFMSRSVLNTTATPDRAYVSKSKFLQGSQCKKLLWHAYNEKDQIPEPDAAQQAIFDQGHEAVALAKLLFPGGVEVSEGVTDFEQVLQQSLEAVKSRKPLFEAGFIYIGGGAQWISEWRSAVSIDGKDPAPRAKDGLGRAKIHLLQQYICGDEADFFVEDWRIPGVNFKNTAGGDQPAMVERSRRGLGGHPVPVHVGCAAGTRAIDWWD
jgi:hypothetical protein